MALKIVKGSIDRMFDKNLQDLVRGIRNHKEDEVRHFYQFISFYIVKIRMRCFCEYPYNAVGINESRVSDLKSPDFR